MDKPRFLEKLPVGTRVVLLRDQERFDHFIAKAGMTGTVVLNDESILSVKIDQHLENCVEWDNCLIWTSDDWLGDDPNEEDLGILTQGRYDDRSFMNKEVVRRFGPVRTLMQDMNEIWSPTGDGVPFIRGMQMIAQEASRIAIEANEQVLLYTGWQKFEAIEEDK